MHLRAKTYLAVLDNEERELLAEYNEGDRIVFLDARGDYQAGVIEEIKSTAIIISQYGKTRRIPYKVIEHVMPIDKWI